MRRTILLCIILLISNVYSGGWGNAGKYGRNTRVRRIVDWQQNMLDSYEALRGELSSTAELELTERLARGTYLDSTFGLNGQHRRSADFILLFEIDDDLVDRDIIKSGATMRWDCEGTVYVQNNMPDHTYAGNGIVTISSTDGFAGITHLDLSGEVGRYPFNKTTTFRMPKWSSICPNLIYINISNSDFRAAVDSLLGLHSVDTLYTYGNGNRELPISGDAGKLNDLNPSRVIAYFSSMYLCIDSLYTWTNLKYLYWFRRAGKVWGDLAATQYWSDDMTYLQISADSIYGSGTALQSKTNLREIGLSNVYGGRTITINNDDIAAMTGLTIIHIVSDSADIDIEEALAPLNPININFGGTSTNDETIYGNISVLSDMTRIQVVEMEGHSNVVGSIGSVAGTGETLVVCRFSNTGVDDILSPLKANTGISEYQLGGTEVTCDSSCWVNDVFYWAYFDSCGWTQAEVDTFIFGFRASCMEETRDYTKTVSGKVWVRLYENAAPSATGLGWIDQIDSCFAANGKAVDWQLIAPEE